MMSYAGSGAGIFCSWKSTNITSCTWVGAGIFSWSESNRSERLVTTSPWEWAVAGAERRDRS